MLLYPEVYNVICQLHLNVLCQLHLDFFLSQYLKSSQSFHFWWSVLTSQQRTYSGVHFEYYPTEKKLKVINISSFIKSQTTPYL